MYTTSESLFLPVSLRFSFVFLPKQVFRCFTMLLSVSHIPWETNLIYNVSGSMIVRPRLSKIYIFLWPLRSLATCLSLCSLILITWNRNNWEIHFSWFLCPAIFLVTLFVAPVPAWWFLIVVSDDTTMYHSEFHYTILPQQKSGRATVRGWTTCQIIWKILSFKLQTCQVFLVLKRVFVCGFLCFLVCLDFLKMFVTFSLGGQK